MTPDQSKYKLFFAGYDGNIEQIGLAFGDDLDDLHVHDTPIIPVGTDSDFDALQTSNPYVYHDGDAYIMIYQARSGVDKHLRFGRAVSRNLIDWEKDAQPWFDLHLPSDMHGKRNGCQHPHMVRDGARWHLFFTRQTGDDTQICTAVSTDLKNWDMHSEPCLSQERDYDSLALYYPWVMKDGESWVMWYSAVSGDWRWGKHKWVIGRAVSDDGLHWTREPERPVSMSFKPGFWSWSRKIIGFANPCVFQNGQGLTLLSHAVLKTGEIATSSHFSDDKGVSWHTPKAGIIRLNRAPWCHKFDGDPFVLLS